MINSVIPAISNHEIEPYRPDGGISVVGLVPALVGSLLAGAVVGYLASLIGQFFYLVLLFPAIMGFLVGGLSALLLRFGHLRNQILGGLIGGLSGIVCVLSLHYFDYLRMAQELAKSVLNFQEQVLDTGNFTLLHYLDLAATQGITIGKFGDKNPLNLGYIGTIIYWVVELGIVVFCTASFPYIACGGPYCLNCRRWKDEKKVANLEGNDAAEITELVKRGELATLLEKAVALKPVGMHLQVATCPKCGEEGTVVVAIQESTIDAKGTTQTAGLVKVVYPGHILRHLPKHLSSGSSE